ncbi:MAG: hypothetical protein ACPG47_00765 [Leucothrix sp.]
MSVNKDLRWLRAPHLKGKAKQFAEFCRKDFPQQARNEAEFDSKLYNEAAKFITEKLQASSLGNTPQDGQ